MFASKMYTLLVCTIPLSISNLLKELSLYRRLHANEKAAAKGALTKVV